MARTPRRRKMTPAPVTEAEDYSTGETTPVTNWPTVQQPLARLDAPPVVAPPAVAPDPDFLRQSAEPMTSEEQGAWLTKVGREFWKAGASHVRYSVHPDRPNLRLVEGWREHPGKEGAPRWQLTDG